MQGFNNLDLYFKSNILSRQAQYITSTRHQQFTVKLFSWDRFFIEQYYDNVQEEITRITLATRSDIDKHLSDLSLTDLDLLL